MKLNLPERANSDRIDKIATTILKSSLIKSGLFDVEEYNGKKVGIDCDVEFLKRVDKTDYFTGKKVSCQIKGMESFIGDFPKYPVKIKHLQYFSQHSLPVVFIIVILSGEKIFWKYMDEEACSIGPQKKTKTVAMDNIFKSETAYTNWLSILGVDDEPLFETTKYSKITLSEIIKLENLNIKEFEEFIWKFRAILYFVGGARTENICSLRNFFKVKQERILAAENLLVDKKVLIWDKGILWFTEKEYLENSKKALDHFLRTEVFEINNLINFQSE